MKIRNTKLNIYGDEAIRIIHCKKNAFIQYVLELGHRTLWTTAANHVAGKEQKSNSASSLLVLNAFMLA